MSCHHKYRIINPSDCLFSFERRYFDYTVQPEAVYNSLDVLAASFDNLQRRFHSFECWCHRALWYLLICISKKDAIENLWTLVPLSVTSSRYVYYLKLCRRGWNGSREKEGWWRQTGQAYVIHEDLTIGNAFYTKHQERLYSPCESISCCLILTASVLTQQKISKVLN